MITLRAGATSRDRRLDRIPRFDDRSRNFRAIDIIPSDVRVTKLWDCTQHLDQGSEGACTGFAVTHELIARPKVVKGLDGDFARTKVYWEAQKVDPWPGGAYPGAKPFYEGSSVLAAVGIAKKLGYIGEYRWAFGLDDLILCVGHLGPAILGINWYQGMSSPVNGLIKPTGSKVGGHAILCKGVRVKHEMFVLHNSWGSNWGHKGDCHISFKDMERLLNESGEAVIPLLRSSKPVPVSVPVPAPVQQAAPESKPEEPAKPESKGSKGKRKDKQRDTELPPEVDEPSEE